MVVARRILKQIQRSEPLLFEKTTNSRVQRNLAAGSASEGTGETGTGFNFPELLLRMPWAFGHSPANGESDETILSPGRSRRKQFSAALKALLKIASVKLPFRRGSSKGPSASTGNNAGRPPSPLETRVEISERATGAGVLLSSAEPNGVYGTRRSSRDNGFATVLVATSILEPPSFLRAGLASNSKYGKSELQLVPADSLAMGHALSMHLPALGGDNIWMICNPLYFGHGHKSVRKQHIRARRDQSTGEITSVFYKSGF